MLGSTPDRATKRFMPERISVRITNTSHHPISTKVEILLPYGDVVDLTEHASVHWPILFSVEPDGIFATLKLPLESVVINDE